MRLKLIASGDDARLQYPGTVLQQYPYNLRARPRPDTEPAGCRPFRKLKKIVQLSTGKFFLPKIAKIIYQYLIVQNYFFNFRNGRQYSISFIKSDRDRSLADSPLVQCQVEREHEVHSRVAGPRPRDTRLRHESSDINIQLSTMGAGVRHSTKIRTSSLDFWSRLSSAVVINTSVLYS